MSLWARRFWDIGSVLEVTNRKKVHGEGEGFTKHWWRKEAQVAAIGDAGGEASVRGVGIGEGSGVNVHRAG